MNRSHTTLVPTSENVPKMRSGLNGCARHLTMFAVVAGSLLIMLMQPPIGQDPGYHRFADERAFLGLPNFLNVASNLGFLIAGIAGVRLCLVKQIGSLRIAWLVLFAGIAFVGVGSTYYHWSPIDQSLVWDRLPMTFGFMGLFVAVLGEYISERFWLMLVPALLAGVTSVIYWHLYDDLRFYVWIQIVPLLTIPAAIFLYRPRYSHQWLLIAALGFYVLAKLAELYDKSIFAATREIVSGHTAKHVLSSIGCFAIFLILRERSAVKPTESIILSTRPV